MRRAIAIVLLSLGPCLAKAGDVEVISARPDAVTVTIYRDLFALVTETRTVDLPAGPVTLSFEGVVETLIPQSAVVQRLDRALEERNYEYDPLAPTTLYAKSIGKTVTLTRTLPGKGKVVQVRAVILAANHDGITLRTADGNEALRCSGLRERLTFEAVPEGLHPEPKLSIRLAAGMAGKRTIRLSYLAQGFGWKSDYIARFGDHPDRMDLSGWVTLRNFTNASFRDAEVQVVAGRLNLLGDDDGGTSTFGATTDYENEGAMQSARDSKMEELESDARDSDKPPMPLIDGCYPLSTGKGSPMPHRYEAEMVVDSLPAGELEQVLVTGARRIGVQRETLGDYQLYRLPWHTDLNARQTKQALFLDKRGVKIERYYSFRLDLVAMQSGEPRDFRPDSMVSFDNRKTSGLGEPLPQGVVRFFDATPDGDFFAGESGVVDEAVGAPVELAIAKAMDLTLTVSAEEDDEAESEAAAFFDVTVRIANAKSHAVPLELRIPQGNDQVSMKIMKSNRRAGRKHGDYLWRFELPANDADALIYRMKAIELDDTGGKESVRDVM